MNQVNSSLEVLTQNNGSFHKSLEMGSLDPDPLKHTSIKQEKTWVFTRLLEDFHNGTSSTFRKNRRTFKLFSYLALHLLLIGYFAWATVYFMQNSDETLNSTTCTGYGFFMILFVLINFGIFYSWIIKPYLIPFIDTVLWNTLLRLLSIRFVKPILYLIILAAIIVYLVFETSNNYRRLIPAGGIVIFLVLGFLLSKHPGQINWRPIIWGLILQFVFGLLTIRWEVGRNVFDCLGNKTEKFLHYATDGSAFVYGNYLVHDVAVFAFQALATIYFLGFCINILYYYGIMQKVVLSLGELLQSVMGTSICESVNSAANIFLGQSEAPLLLKPYLADLTASEIHAIMTSGFATVSGSVLAAYISFGASPTHLITSSVMSAPAALCFSKLMYPETEKTKATRETISILKPEYSSVMDAGSKGASLASEIVLAIIANLISFIAFMYFLNGVFSWMGELVGYYGEYAWALEKVFGYIFMPVSFIMGVPWDECEYVGRLIGIKTIINEFAAFKEMGAMTLSPRTKAIATYAICGFSNPGSLGIMISALSVLMPTKRDIVTRVIFRAFFSGEVVCFMTACIAAILIPDNLL